MKRVPLLVVCLFACSANLLWAQSAAQLLYPVDGATGVDLSQPARWSAVANAEAYYLYVGTTVGANDLTNSREISATSYPVKNVLPGQTVYARLWTRLAGVWAFSDSTFTAATLQQMVATLIFPPDGATTADISQPIRWTTIANAQAYYLYVGTTPGAKDVIDSRTTLQTSYAAGSVPIGQLLYARLWTLTGGVWRYADSTFTAAPPLLSTLTVPAPNSSDFDGSKPFQWTTTTNAEAYYLYVGTSVGAKDVVGTGEIHQTSYAPPLLSPTVTYYARLWTKWAGVWRYADSQFTTAPVARLTTPGSDAANVDPTRPSFAWTSVSGAQAYYLYVGTSVGAKDLVDSHETPQTSFLSAPLPASTTLFARLWTKWNGIWRFIDSQFTTLPVARLTSPAAGATNINPTRASFTWAPLSGAQAYYLYVGTIAGAKDVIDTGETQETTVQSSHLPVGQTLFVRLWTKFAGTWRFVDSQFTTVSVAILTSASSGAISVDPTQPFTWSAVPGAQAYYLYVGTSVGTKDLVDSREIQQPSYAAPAGWSERAAATEVGWDVSADATPADGYAITVDGVRTDLGVLFPSQCPATLGPTPCFRAPLPPRTTGAHSVRISAYNASGEQTSADTVFSEPIRIVYVRLWTEVAGVWQYTDSSFTPARLSAQFLYPAFGANDVDGTKSFTWGAVPGADRYSLTVGLTAGGNDLIDEPLLYGTSYPALAIASLPASYRVFARIGTRVQGVWRYSETTFTGRPLARLIYPTNGTLTVASSTWFSWEAVANAQGYYLYVGTTPGAKDVVDSRVLHTESYYAANLPAIALYARLWTQTNGVWRFTDTLFTVSTAPVSNGGGGGSSPDLTPPSVPAGLSAAATSPSQIALDWTDTTDNVAVAGYRVYRDSQLIATIAAISAFSDSGLLPLTTHTYVVAALDAAGNVSMPSSQATATTFAADTVAPSAPADVHVAGVSSTMVALSWTASTDNVGVAGYGIYRDGNRIATAGTPAYLDYGLSPNRTYLYAVAAFDASGNNSVQSSGASAATPPGPAYPLMVSTNGRYLVDQNQRPFLMAGDSPQSMIGNLSESDAQIYLADRQAVGFNAVRVNLLCNGYTYCRADGSTFDGLTPFSTPGDLSTPNDAYFRRSDSMIRIAAGYGITVLLNPIETGGWLDILRLNGVAKARAYGRYLGARYSGYDNIVWLNGNDFDAWNVESVDAVVQAVALGIRDVDARHIQTVQLNYSSSGSLDDARWAPIIGLDAAYTYYPTYARVLQEYNRSTVPVFLVESNYEFEQNHVDIGTPEVLRRQEYWALLSGATGHLYGNHYTLALFDGWKTQLRTRGAIQAGYVTALFGGRRWYDLIPDQNHTVVTAGIGTFLSCCAVKDSDYVTAARTSDGSLVIAYLPSIRAVTVNMASLSGAVTARWYDPTNGVFLAAAANPLANAGSRQFTPPGANGDGATDWVLVLEH